MSRFLFSNNIHCTLVPFQHLTDYSHPEKILRRKVVYYFTIEFHVLLTLAILTKPPCCLPVALRNYRDAVPTVRELSSNAQADRRR
jgi:hypothetical protein